jgi:putative ABC transport system permease protein
MLHPLLASKKNVIIGVAALVVIFMVGSYYMEQKHLHKKVLLGGPVELVVQNAPVSKMEWSFIKKNSSKVAVLNDMVTDLPLTKGVMQASVRAFSKSYPLRGTLNLERTRFKVVFSVDKKQNLYGVAVNKEFLKRSGMDIGESFTMGSKNYQLRALINDLPDTVGNNLNDKEPLMLLNVSAMYGSGMYANAMQREVRYLIQPKKKVSARKWIGMYKRSFPRSIAVVKRWDA